MLLLNFLLQRFSLANLSLGDDLLTIHDIGGNHWSSTAKAFFKYQWALAVTQPVADRTDLEEIKLS